MAAMLAPLLFSPLLELFILTLHIILPARTIEGYVRDNKGRPLKYRLNGPLVLATTVLPWALLCATGLLAWDFLYTHYWATLASACTTGLLCTVYFITTGDYDSRPGPDSNGKAQSSKRNGESATVSGPPPGSLAEFFLGRLLNPRFHVTIAGEQRVVDVKMVLYLIGAVHLELNVLSSVAAHYVKAAAAEAEASSSSSSSSSTSTDSAQFQTAFQDPGLPLAAAFLTFFVIEYLYWEHVHLYTYDIFAERIGFKLVWGCMCFYPFFYPIGIVAGATLPHQTTSYTRFIFAAIVFFTGWGLSRGANLQKHRFKLASASSASSGTSSRDRNQRQTIDKDDNWNRQVIVSRDGSQTLYCGGLWGLARHVNYVGEILEAVGIALAVGGGGVGGGGGDGGQQPILQANTTITTPTATMWILPWLPWLYPLYYVGLLVTRERDDDTRCREKYGLLWDDYCRRVPYRLVPFVY